MFSYPLKNPILLQTFYFLVCFNYKDKLAIELKAEASNLFIKVNFWVIIINLSTVIPNFLIFSTKNDFFVNDQNLFYIEAGKNEKITNYEIKKGVFE